MPFKQFFTQFIRQSSSKLRRHKKDPQALPEPVSLQTLTGLNSFESLPARPWQLETLVAPIHWTTDDQAILTYHEGSKARCLLRIGCESEYRQTVLVAFDLEANRVLLDYPFPHTNIDILKNTQHICLMLNAPSGRITLALKFEKELRTPYESALVMNVMSKRCHSDRRVQRRVHFDNQLAPTGRIDLPMRPGLKGKVMDLSEGGFCLKVYGPKDVSILRSRGDCLLDIDTHFQLKCRVEIRDGRFSREPCAHTLVRVMFRDLSLANQDRLRAFLIAMDNNYIPVKVA